MEQPSTKTPPTREPTVRKTFQSKLHPTPEQEQAVERVLWLCRPLETAARAQRLTGWRRGQGKSATRFQQEAELTDLRAAFPD